ncbi:MAG: Hypothetical protein AJITA_01130 [Acetilactobacillus jinshanensis]
MLVRVQLSVLCYGCVGEVGQHTRLWPVHAWVRVPHTALKNKYFLMAV